MKINKIIKKFEELKEKHGNCDVLLWDNMTLSYTDIEDIIFMTKENNFNESLADDEEYVEEFKKIENNIVIL